MPEHQLDILLVILHADPARGGAERYTVDLARGLAELGHVVTLAAGSFGPAIEGVDFALLDAGGWSRVGRYQRFLRSLRSHTEGRRHDIVHAMMPVERCDLYHPHAGIEAQSLATGHEKHRTTLARAAARFLNRLNRKRRLYAQVERLLLEPDDGPVVLCLSQYIRQAALRHYPLLAENRLPIVLNGVDLGRFDPRAEAESRGSTRDRLGLRQEHVAALMIAQDYQRKGLAQTIEALARVNDNRLRLVVAGRPDPSHYRRMAEQLGVADRVVFAGPTSRPADFYRACDFFVLPTRHDPCSLVVLEALAMGLPVISTACNGACEAMAEGVHGLILPDPDNVPALADAMRQLLDWPKRQLMRRACLDLREQISQEQHVRRIVEVYRRVLDRKRR